MREIPKLEILNPNQIRNPKSEIGFLVLWLFGSLFRISNLGFRVSARKALAREAV